MVDVILLWFLPLFPCVVVVVVVVGVVVVVLFFFSFFFFFYPFQSQLALP